MSVDLVEYYAADAPTGIPSYDSIVQQCAAAGYSQNGIDFKVEGIPPSVILGLSFQRLLKLSNYRKLVKA